MTLGTILGASFQVMRRNPRTTLAPALILSAIVTFVVAMGLTAYAAALFRIPNAASSSDAAAFTGGAFIGSLLLLLMAGAVSLAATAVLQAIIVTEVARGTVGEKLKLGQIWAAVRGRTWAVIGYTTLLALAIVVYFAVFFVITTVILAATASTTSIGVSMSSVASAAFLAIGIVILASLGGGVVWLWLSTKLAFVPAAIVIERLSIRAAIARSWRLTRGYFWRTLGILLLVAVMIWIASQIATLPVNIVFSMAGPLFFPTGGADPTTGIAILVVALVLTLGVALVVTAIGMVLQSATASLLYLDLRMRKEGLDLELGRFVELRAAGSEAPDPYLPHSPTLPQVPTHSPAT